MLTQEKQPQPRQETCPDPTIRKFLVPATRLIKEMPERFFAGNGYTRGLKITEIRYTDYSGIETIRFQLNSPCGSISLPYVDGHQTFVVTENEKTILLDTIGFHIIATPNETFSVRFK